jgi:hypothetical protein
MLIWSGAGAFPDSEASASAIPHTPQKRASAATTASSGSVNRADVSDTFAATPALRESETIACISLFTKSSSPVFKAPWLSVISIS